MIIIGFLIKLDSKGPVFFKQERIGKDFKKFMILKFRTMTAEKRAVGNKPIIGRAEGVTRIGYYLRRFKIDELPQLINVLRLEMSLVGPRPNVESNLDGMTNSQLTRYSVRPGLTGLAQISGNIHLTWKERFKYDLLYLRRVSFLNDLRIILRTLMVIIRGEEKFKGKDFKLL